MSPPHHCSKSHNLGLSTPTCKLCSAPNLNSNMFLVQSVTWQSCWSMVLFLLHSLIWVTGLLPCRSSLLPGSSFGLPYLRSSGEHWPLLPHFRDTAPLLSGRIHASLLHWLDYWLTTPGGIALTLILIPYYHQHLYQRYSTRDNFASQGIFDNV